jgi:diaminohydroxyphosphoribosylaminopyrimidine deaminase / 5-amino-6-(5-phosphoribosylamino)uracil reductase
MDKEQLIRRTFELARQGLGSTWPNPMVGAVITKDGKIIGEGFHQRYGGDHAEIEALKKCTESPEGATIYVNLEPCCHTNKQTPPCAQRLVQEKIKKVVICNLDPNPAVNGKGVELLKKSGIEVEYGILSSEGEELNEVFFTAQKKRRPFVHLKLATTLDGKIALSNGESQWITGEASRRRVHELRSQCQAILIGAETLRKDDPSLTVRRPDFTGKQPLRVIFTESGRLDPKAKVFNDEWRTHTLVFTKTSLQLADVKALKFTTLEGALQSLFDQKIINVFLEGGANLATQFLTQGLVDRVSLFMNPSFLGEGRSALGNLGVSTLSERPTLKNIKSEMIEGDLFLTGIF